ncbi:hypothetical protein [Streptomyces sp. NPDC059828]|uniref:hypothetical protein n=1 Tax=Streptomyces sp. NPDC059828 TaxID=3346965 RepID=UPI00364F8C6D
MSFTFPGRPGLCAALSLGLAALGTAQAAAADPPDPDFTLDRPVAAPGSAARSR